VTIWLGLLVAPILALVDQTVALSMTTWVCRGQHGLAIHIVHAAFAVATTGATLLAWQRWHQEADDATGSETAARRRFLAGMAIGVSALSLLVVVTMWFPTWLISSCLD
jgi:hypothetical protein